MPWSSAYLRLIAAPGSAGIRVPPACADVEDLLGDRSKVRRPINDCQIEAQRRGCDRRHLPVGKMCTEAENWLSGLVDARRAIEVRPIDGDAPWSGVVWTEIPQSIQKGIFRVITRPKLSHMARKMISISPWGLSGSAARRSARNPMAASQVRWCG